MKKDVYVSLQKKAIEKLYIPSYFEFVSTDSPWLYLLHLLNLMPQLIFEQNSPWQESNICRLLPKYFQIFKIFLVYFWSSNLGLDPTNHIFHLKKKQTNLESCMELNKVINTRNFVEKKLPDISGFSWKNCELKSSQKVNEVCSHRT